LTATDLAGTVARTREVLDDLAALVVVGGDGMVRAGVNLVAGGTVPLGIVPAGTGNDVARALGLPADPVAAARALAEAVLEGRTRAVDAACVCGPDGDSWFAGVLGAGFDAVVNERANGWRWVRGRSRYTLAVARELPVFRPRDYTLTLDGAPWRTRAMLVAVANGPSYGGGMRVAPAASMGDGLLDVLVVGPLSRREFVRVFPRVFRGTHVEHPAVTIRRAVRVDIAAEGIVAYADGERVGRLPLRCEVVPGVLSLLGVGPAG
jgi:diacylglycerol kinase (ATP)